MALYETLSHNLQIGMVADPLASPHWPAAKLFLHPALMESDEDWPNVAASLHDGHAQLWLVLSKGGDPVLAAAVTRRIETRKGDAVEVFLVGGRDHHEWIGPLNTMISLAAKHDGCVSMRAYGRLGWVKTLRALGWMADCVCYEKAL